MLIHNRYFHELFLFPLKYYIIIFNCVSLSVEHYKFNIDVYPMSIKSTCVLQTSCVGLH